MSVSLMCVMIFFFVSLTERIDVMLLVNNISDVLVNLHVLLEVMPSRSLMDRNNRKSRTRPWVRQSIRVTPVHAIL